MYRYTEQIGGLTRTYEAESPEKVVELVLAVTIDIQPEIDKRYREGQQLTNVDVVKLENLIKSQSEDQVHTGIFLNIPIGEEINKDRLIKQLSDRIMNLAINPMDYDAISYR